MTIATILSNYTLALQYWRPDDPDMFTVKDLFQLIHMEEADKMKQALIRNTTTEPVCQAPEPA